MAPPGKRSALTTRVPPLRSREAPAWLTIAYRLPIARDARDDGGTSREIRGRDLGTLFRILFWLFLVLYVAAVAGFAGVILGYVPFGSPITMLLVPLGLPWGMFADQLPRMSIFGLGLSFWAAFLAPAINLLILWVLARLTRRRAV